MSRYAWVIRRGLRGIRGFDTVIQVAGLQQVNAPFRDAGRIEGERLWATTVVQDLSPTAVPGARSGVPTGAWNPDASGMAEMPGSRGPIPITRKPHH